MGCSRLRGVRESLWDWQPRSREGVNPPTRSTTARPWPVVSRLWPLALPYTVCCPSVPARRLMPRVRDAYQP